MIIPTIVSRMIIRTASLAIRTKIASTTTAPIMKMVEVCMT